MTAAELVAWVSQVIFVAILLLTLARLVRRPTSPDLNVVLFFGSLALVLVSSRVAAVFGPISRPGVILEVALLLAMPYLLLRLVDDFTRVPRAVHALMAGGMATSIALFAALEPLPPLAALALTVSFAAGLLYCAAMFVRRGSRAEGVNRRRMEAISIGSVLLGAVLLLAGVGVLLPPGERAVLTAASQVALLASAVAYYLGFVPPPLLRRAWQDPGLRSFMAGAARRARMAGVRELVAELERGASATLGSEAHIALLLDDARTLRSWDADDEPFDRPADQGLVGRAFTGRRIVFSSNPERDNPAGAEAYRQRGIGAVLAVPIVGVERRLGVLAFHAERPPLFAESDIEIASLLAGQAAIAIESRELTARTATLQAREEANRLKEDFLSAAAHDLRTPLTTVVAQAEFLERRATRDPSQPVDVVAVGRIVREAKRLATLVTELLDGARLAEGGFASRRESVDLAAVAREVAARAMPAGLVELEASCAIGLFDRRRMEQLLENLVENALKYSEGAAPVKVSVRAEAGEARIEVRDRGIGIPPADLPRLFERFTRGSNVDDRRFQGMGLGLYICKGIVEEHGGRIWAESATGQGSAFHVTLPLDGGRRVS